MKTIKELTAHTLALFTAGVGIGAVLVTAALLVLMSGCNTHDHKHRTAKAQPGDINGDGVVDMLDHDLLHDMVFGPEISDPLPGPLVLADLNEDGVIDIADLVILFELLGLPHNGGTHHPHCPHDGYGCHGECHQECEEDSDDEDDEDEDCDD